MGATLFCHQNMCAKELESDDNKDATCDKAWNLHVEHTALVSDIVSPDPIWAGPQSLDIHLDNGR